MKAKEIIEYLDEIIPNPKCELNYNKDYELLIATMLSAQTTDKRVNEVTKVLFNKYDSLKKLKEANIKDIENIIKELGNYHKKSEAIINIAKILDEKYNGKNQIYGAFAGIKDCKITIPSTVTSIDNQAFYKSSSSNPNLTKIINKTGKSFDWKVITGGIEKVTFEVGTVKTSGGNIEITKN